ncbi:MAG: ABC transporter ATP-binding protein [Desulfobacterales bacterium]|nr:ABC transporter ATP-binding protein [Desulfobacterales bacterium]
MILNVKNVSKSYPQPERGNLQVLTDCSFGISKGETTAITGQSGSGKTTLLSLIAGLDSPDSGSVILDGTDINGMSEDKLARFRARKTGMIFQQFHLMPHLTAEENVKLPIEILKSDRIEEKALSILEKVGLTDRKDHMPGQLSGGECQRVAIARALVVEPKVLLADEPTGNLDVKTGDIVADLLFDLVDSSNMTLVVVTHNPDLASRCERELTLAKGKLV